MMIKLLLVLGWFFTGVWWVPMAYAGQADLERERMRLFEKQTGQAVIDEAGQVDAIPVPADGLDVNANGTLKDNPNATVLTHLTDEAEDALISDGTLDKPVLSEKEESDLLTRGFRARRTGEFKPPVGKTFRPDDYANATKRGTVEYNPSWRNYSYHTVQIPDGTVLDGEVFGGCNFSQIAPVTDALDRSPGVGHNLTFRNCNLVNVKVYPDWIIENCNTAQIDRIGTLANDEDSPEITESVYVSDHSDTVDADRVKPVGALE